MVSASLLLALAAGPDAAPVAAPLFCDRMAKPYKMGRASGTKLKIYVGRLRADKGAVQYTGRNIVENGEPCTTNMGTVRCIIAGPGELVISHAGFNSKWPINEGERAVFMYSGKMIACQDLSPSESASAQ